MNLGDIDIEDQGIFHINNSYYQTYLMDGDEGSLEQADQEPNQLQQSKKCDQHPEPALSQSQNLDNHEDSQNSCPLEEMVICRVCEKPIVFAAQTYCGHCFCQICILEYFLVLGDCPVCKAAIRDKKYYANKTIDNFIEGYVDRLGESEVEEYQGRKQKAKNYKAEKTLDVIEPGVYIDIRDENFVWKKGIITRTFNRTHKGERIKFFIARYLNSQKKQEFSPASSRVAREGFYTKRQDIPKMKKGEIVIEDKEQKNIYFLPKESGNGDSSEEAKSC